MPPRKPPETRSDSDDEADEDFDAEDDDASEDDFEFEDDEDEDDEEEDDLEDEDDEDDVEEGSGDRGAGGRRKDPSDCSPPASAEGAPRTPHPASDESPPRRPRARSEPKTRARGPGGMGRPSTGPAIRRPPALDVEPGMTEEEPLTELAPDISAWPGTAEAARMVGRHTSTIKAWRAQGRIRAQQDGSGCWRYHPDDLAEAIDTPDGTDPGSILAQGMTAIVSQGASANERLLAMTELATDGLKDATKVLAEQLKAAYAHIRDLEKELGDLRNKASIEELRHQRQMRKLDHKHELDIVGAKETSERLNGLLTVLGPIAASIGQRVLGNITGAETLEAEASGVGRFKVQGSGPETPSGASAASASERVPPAPSEERPAPPCPAPGAGGAPDMPFEARITQAMARLCDVIRKLDSPAFAGLRAMLPPKVAAALDDVKQAADDGTVGRALAIIVQASQGLSDLQFIALKPIAPADVAAVLGELRELLKDVKFQPE